MEGWRDGGIAGGVREVGNKATPLGVHIYVAKMSISYRQKVCGLQAKSLWVIVKKSVGHR